jgi:hypothetical protein
MPENIHIARK